MNAFDAILIPGGGLLPDGKPPRWVRERLDKAVEIADARFFVPLSRGTVHKAPPLDERGFPIDESRASAMYLLERGVPEDRILTETVSLDTIGNAYFSRVIHIDPMALVRLLVITSSFHFERARAVFQWVYGLSGGSCQLTVIAVPDSGIDHDSLKVRRGKERRSLLGLRQPMREIETLEQLQQWLFLRHDAYNLKNGHSNIGSAINTY